MKTFVIGLGLAALPFAFTGLPAVAGDMTVAGSIIVAESHEDMEKTEPPFSETKPGDEPFDSDAGAPDDEGGMSMEPADQEDMDDSMSDDSMPDDSME